MRCTASISTCSGTVSTEPSPAVSGEGSVSRQRFTPTTISSPASMPAMRRALLFHERALHVAALDGGDGAAHVVDGGELGARGLLQLVDLALRSPCEPSKMSPYSSRSVS